MEQHVSDQPRTRQTKYELDHWEEDDSIGKKRQRLVRWLMRKGVSLDKARLIAWKKYR